MVMCVKRDLMKVPECINKLSEYVLDIENTKYRDIITCSPVGEVSSFQDLIDLENNAPVAVCVKPFGDDHNQVIRTLTKHDLIEYFLDRMDFILADNHLLFYSVKELEIYFKYMKALYEEEE